MSLSRKPKTINPDEVDPSVYYYDEVYDDMKNEESQSEKQSEDKCDKPKGSKYIQGLIDTADQRKAEKELRKFKKFARDREEAEAEGDLDESDVYITPTYKRKLEEIKKIDEAKRRRIELEKDNVMNFLTKKSDPEPTESHKSPETSTKETNPIIEDEIQTVDDNRSESHRDEPNPPAESVKSDIPDRPRKKVPKTYEERREYLREVLGKRTVGKVFEEAVQRYKIRCATR